MIITTESDVMPIFGMTNLAPKNTDLNVFIWTDHMGAYRNVSHSIPRVKIGTLEYSESVSIEPNPKILAKSSKIKRSEQKKIDEAIEYVGRNHDLFLKHYQDDGSSFSDFDLLQALIARGDLHS